MWCDFLPDPEGARLPTILVVDDEPDIARAVSMALRAKLPGTEVATATSGPDALAFLQTRPVDLLVTDYKMPGITGVDLLVAFHKASPTTARVMMTAYADVDVAMRALNDGHVSHFLTKPFPPHQLIDIARGILEDRHASELRQRAFRRALGSGPAAPRP